MGFSDAREQALKYLESGKVQHEARDNINEKNLLAVGTVTVEQVVSLLKATKGSQYSSSQHGDDQSITVHVCQPELALDEGDEEVYDWYIKFYFLEPNLVFISVHKSHVPKKPKSKAKVIRRIRIK